MSCFDTCVHGPCIKTLPTLHLVPRQHTCNRPSTRPLLTPRLPPRSYNSQLCGPPDYQSWISSVSGCMSVTFLSKWRADIVPEDWLADVKSTSAKVEPSESSAAGFVAWRACTLVCPSCIWTLIRSFLSSVIEKAVREYDGKIRCSVWIGVGNELLSEQSVAFVRPVALCSPFSTLNSHRRALHASSTRPHDAHPTRSRLPSKHDVGRF